MGYSLSNSGDTLTYLRMAPIITMWIETLENKHALEDSASKERGTGSEIQYAFMLYYFPAIRAEISLHLWEVQNTND